MTRGVIHEMMNRQNAQNKNYEEAQMSNNCR